VLVIYLATSVVGGIGLLMGKEWGRVISIIANALNIPSFPIGRHWGYSQLSI